MPFEIRSTLRPSPIRAIVYGGDGVGKSTLAAGAPGCVFVDIEGGLTNIDTRAVVPTTWADILEAVDALVADPSCQTIAIDSLDWAESMCWQTVCDRGDDKGRKQKSIEDFGYGKGYVAALGEWRQLIAKLESADRAGKNVILIAHAHRKAVKNPNGEDYEQWQIKLNEKAAGLFREWARIVAFAELDIVTNTDAKDGGRSKGIWTGKRVLRTQPSAGYQGKTRITLPASIPLDWKAFSDAVAASKPPSVADLQVQLAALIGADEELLTRTTKFLDARGRTAASYSDAIANVQRIIESKPKDEAAQ